MFDKVSGLSVYICGIEVSTAGFSIPSNIEGWQPFFNTIVKDAEFQKAHTSFSAVSFLEEADPTPAGTIYKQKLTFRFPNHDANRSSRIFELSNIKYYKIKLTNGSHIIIGRNDFYQNTKPKLAVKSNQSTTDVEVLTASMFPSGYGALNSFGLPTFIPINLVQL